MKPDGVSAIQISHSEVRISYHYVVTHEEACELYGTHEALHEENPMPNNCIKCEDKNARATNNKTTQVR
jgi:hypothetical protein